MQRSAVHLGIYEKAGEKCNNGNAKLMAKLNADLMCIKSLKFENPMLRYSHTKYKNVTQTVMMKMRHVIYCVTQTRRTSASFVDMDACILVAFYIENLYQIIQPKLIHFLRDRHLPSYTKHYVLCDKSTELRMYFRFDAASPEMVN